MAYNLLVVDDSSIVRKVILRALGMTGLPTGQILEAENGKQALEALKSQWVDLIFLDINMPIMNGMEFMTALRADPDLKDLPVVIVSTEGSKERREALEKLGVKGYLRKPATPEQLTATITSLLGPIQQS